MNTNEELKFNPEPITRAQLCSAAVSFNGLPYDESATYVRRGVDGKATGFANCFGVLLLAAHECNLLHPKIAQNLALPPMTWGQRKEATLWQIIKYNFTEVPKEEMRAGDVLLFRYHDLDIRLKEPHHVGLCVADAPGRILHASQEIRRTSICGMDALFSKRIEHCYSLNNFTD